MIKKIKEIAKLYPNKIAYTINSDSITYKDLLNKSTMYANYLKRQPANNIILLLDKSIDLITAIIACLIAKRTYIPLDPSIPYNRFKNILKQVNNNLIISNTSIKEIQTIKLKELSKYKNNKKYDIKNDIAYIIFTSGSTGEPKGVPITYSNLTNFINWFNSLTPLKDYKNIKVLNQASFSFDLSVADFYYALTNGHTLVSITPSLDESIFTILKDIDVAIVTPTFIKYCLLNKEFNSTSYPNLKCLYFCGEQLEIKTVKKLTESFPDLAIINAYGPTEATSAVSAYLVSSDTIDKYDILPVGIANNFATTIEIIDDEIILKGPSVFNGYLNNIKGGYYKENNINCYKTGDIGYIKDGYLFCKGRKDNQIKYKGYRIELEEIEHHINKIPSVKECAVIARYNDNNIVKSITAFICIDKSLDETTIKEYLKKSLPTYMIPNNIRIIDKLPINNNGKIDRKALKKL